MAEEKEGFLKRLFRFGKKKRDDEEPEVDNAAAEAVAEAARVEAELHAEAKRKAAEEERLTAEARTAEEARLEAERQEAERKATEETARLEAEARKATEERAKTEAELAARKVEKARLTAEKDAADKEAKAEAERAEAERIAAQERAEATRLEAECKETERLAAEERAKAEREAIEVARLAAEREVVEKAEAERIAADETAKQEEERLAEKQVETEQLEAEAAERATAEKEARRGEEERQAAAKAERKAAELTVGSTAEDGASPETSTADHVETPEPVSEKPKPIVAEAEESTPATATSGAVKKSWLLRMRHGLSRSSTQLTENITSVFTKKKLDADTLEALEDILIQADLGIETAMNVTEALASQRMGKDVTDEEVRMIMASEIEKVLDPVAAELELDLDHTPHVILVVGVNGSGKTTTIGKLSQKLYDAGFSTLLVAGDTFRAAAIEQLKIWGDRTQSPVTWRRLGADSAGLAFDAYNQAKEEGRDVMLMDTAGRLQNKTELMDELAKIIRVLKKQDPSAPHTVLLTLDATTGQNALNQVEVFKDVAGVNGLVMTKLDGTARGGILVSISAKHKLPIFFIGVGEQVDDLEPFEARDFARTIAGLEA